MHFLEQVESMSSDGLSFIFEILDFISLKQVEWIFLNVFISSPGMSCDHVGSLAFKS